MVADQLEEEECKVIVDFGADFGKEDFTPEIRNHKSAIEKGRLTDKWQNTLGLFAGYVEGKE